MTQDAHAGHGDCSEVLHRIYEYLDGEMSADDVRRVAAHLNECQPCLAEHDLDVALKQVVRRSCSGETAPLAVRMQIMQRITMVRLDNTTAESGAGRIRAAATRREHPVCREAYRVFLSYVLRRWACGRGWPCCPCASGACGRACSWGAFRRGRYA